MNPEPLRGKIMFDALIHTDNSNFGTRDEVIEQWQKFAKNVKSAIEFYEAYKNNALAFLNDSPETVLDHYRDWANKRYPNTRRSDFDPKESMRLNTDLYKDWIFYYSFEDLMDESGE